MPEHDWTEKQGQYLAFIYNYSVIHGEPPAEAFNKPYTSGGTIAGLGT